MSKTALESLGAILASKKKSYDAAGLEMRQANLKMKNLDTKRKDLKIEIGLLTDDITAIETADKNHK